MKHFLVALLVALATTAFGQSSSKIGTAAPELEFAPILNFNKNVAKLSDFSAKVVIIDFWATSCAPCITSLAHLEALQQKFPNELQVITITDESEERLKKFFSRRTTTLPVVIDAERKAAAHFPHRIISHTVLIDQQGIVRAITSPEKITEQIIRKVLARETIQLPEKKEVMEFDFTKALSGEENVIAQLTVLPYQNGLGQRANTSGGTGEYKNRRILAVNLSPGSLFEIAYQYPISTRTEVKVKDLLSFESNENSICLDLIVPEEDGDQRFATMQQKLDSLLPYKVTVEALPRVVKVLKVQSGKKAKLPLSAGETSEYEDDGGGMQMTNSPATAIAEFLEGRFNIPVIDETGLSGRYDLQLAWSNEQPELIHDELSKLGLELVEDERKIEVLVISDK